MKNYSFASILTKKEKKQGKKEKKHLNFFDLYIFWLHRQATFILFFFACI